MEKAELLRLLKDNLTVTTELTVLPYCGPQLETTVSFGDVELSKTTSSVNLSYLKSDGMYY